MKEISYYKSGLRAMLREAGDERLNDEEFIDARVEKACATAEQMRLEGHDPQSSLEVAWNVLVEGIFKEN